MDQLVCWRHVPLECFGYSVVVAERVCWLHECVAQGYLFEERYPRCSYQWSRAVRWFMYLFMMAAFVVSFSYSYRKDNSSFCCTIVLNRSDLCHTCAYLWLSYLGCVTSTTWLDCCLVSTISSYVPPIDHISSGNILLKTTTAILYLRAPNDKESCDN